MLYLSAAACGVNLVSLVLYEDFRRRGEYGGI
jgi:hypothetical protein